MGILATGTAESDGVLRKDTLIAAVYEQRESTLRRVATLSDEQWETVCPSPRVPRDVIRLEAPSRRVKDLVAHLIVVDEMAMRGGALLSWAGMRRLESPGAWDQRRITPLTDLSVTELVTLLARRGERFGHLASAAPTAVAHLPVRGPFGRQPLLQVVGRRVLHEWLHEGDIAAGQGHQRRGLPARPVAEVLADAVLGGLHAATLPRVTLAAGVVRLLVDVEEGGSTDVSAPGRRVWSVDFARHQYGPRVAAAPDATVRTSASALALVANGRASWGDDAAALEVTGDVAMAWELLDEIAVPEGEQAHRSPRSPLSAC